MSLLHYNVQNIVKLSWFFHKGNIYTCWQFEIKLLENFP